VIHFPPLRTGRLNVQLRELTIREAVGLAAMPPSAHEAATTALLKLIVVEANGPNQEQGRWTVQERMFVVAHYLACTAETGNFQIGEGRFLDYLRGDIDAAPGEVDAGEACGDQWRARQLTGDEAVAAEGLCRDRLNWVAADMAARLYVPGEDGPKRPDASEAPAAFSAWLAERTAVIESMAESDFEQVFAAYRRGLEGLQHLFWLEFDEGGHVVMPKEGGAALAPARFPVAAALGAVSRILGE
jgi:hypothetical protein